MIPTFLAFLLIIGASFLTATLVARSQRGGSRSDKELEEMRERLLRLEQSVESMAADVDRVSEGQRFMTALLEDRAKSQPALPRPEKRGEPGGQ